MFKQLTVQLIALVSMSILALGSAAASKVFVVADAVLSEVESHMCIRILPRMP